MPKFSVIIPVYNVEPYISQCMDSLKNQSFPNYEIIITDDRGNDNSIKIVEEYAKEDKRIKIITHNKNRGPAAARNTALEHCSGEYIVCLDSDDWLEPHALATLYTVFQNAKTNSVWFNAKKYYQDSGTFDTNAMFQQNEGYRILTPYNIASYNDFSWIKAYKRESIQKYNLKWPEGLTFEDGEFYFKYFTINPKTYVIPDCLINYRHREHSIVREADLGNVKMQDIYDVVKNLRKFWIDLGVYDRYKTTLLKLIQNRVRMCYKLNYSDYNKELSYKFLKDINYPDDFISEKQSKADKNPLVSIVVPFYNVEEYISECLDSIINQTYKNIEIICVDDCGEDNSLSIVKEYAKQDSRIKILSHNKNRGLGSARNTGLEYAGGKYIFFVDSDDWLEKDCVCTAVRKMIETGYNVIFFKSDVYYQKSGKRGTIWYNTYANWPEGEIVFDNSNICKIPNHSWNKCYKREFLIENNIRWPEDIIYEDIEVTFRLFTKSPESYMIDKVLYVYRIRDNSIIANCYNKFTKAEELYTAHKKIYDFLVKNNLIEKYKSAFIELSMLCLNNYRNNTQLNNLLEPQMLEYLNYINFPDGYKEIGGNRA